MSDGAVGKGQFCRGWKKGLLQGQGPCQGLLSWCNARVIRAAPEVQEGCSHLSGLEETGQSPCPDSHGRAATSNEGLQGQATMAKARKPSPLSWTKWQRSPQLPVLSSVCYCGPPVWKPFALTDMMSVPQAAVLRPVTPQNDSRV